MTLAQVLLTDAHSLWFKESRVANLFRILMLLVFVVTAGLTAGCSQKEGVPGAKQAQPPALTAHTLGEQ